MQLMLVNGYNMTSGDFPGVQDGHFPGLVWQAWVEGRAGVDALLWGPMNTLSRQMDQHQWLWPTHQARSSNVHKFLRGQSSEGPL